MFAKAPNVLQNGIRKLTKKVEKETWDTYDASVNPVEFFVREALEKTDDDEDKITMIEMHEYFNEFAEKKESDSYLGRYVNQKTAWS